jgi:hypothetical protein
LNKKVTLQPQKRKKKELLFVNKKKQKNFGNFWPVALQRPWRRGANVFWFLRPDDEAALAAPLRSSKPDEAESGRANLRLVFFCCFFVHNKADSSFRCKTRLIL